MTLGARLRQRKSHGESIKTNIMIYGRRLFSRENSQRTRDEWSAKLKLSPRCLATYKQAQPVALLRDLCAGSACRLFPFHYNIEYQREFAT